jgi:hypothetical protein
MIRVGSTREGTRLGKVLYDKLSSEQLAPVLVGLLRTIRDKRPAGQTPGDFLYETPEAELRALVGIEI